MSSLVPKSTPKPKRKKRQSGRGMAEDIGMAATPNSERRVREDDESSPEGAAEKKVAGDMARDKEMELLRRQLAEVTLIAQRGEREFAARLRAAEEASAVRVREVEEASAAKLRKAEEEHAATQRKLAEESAKLREMEEAKFRAEAIAEMLWTTLAQMSLQKSKSYRDAYRTLQPKPELVSVGDVSRALGLCESALPADVYARVKADVAKACEDLSVTQATLVTQATFASMAECAIVQVVTLAAVRALQGVDSSVVVSPKAVRQVYARNTPDKVFDLRDSADAAAQGPRGSSSGFWEDKREFRIVQRTVDGKKVPVRLSLLESAFWQVAVYVVNRTAEVAHNAAPASQATTVGFACNARMVGMVVCRERPLAAVLGAEGAHPGAGGGTLRSSRPHPFQVFRTDAVPFIPAEWPEDPPAGLTLVWQYLHTDASKLGCGYAVPRTQWEGMELGKRVGSGSTSEVYVAKDNDDVVIKVPRSKGASDRDCRKAIVNEFKQLQSLAAALPAELRSVIPRPLDGDNRSWFTMPRMDLLPLFLLSQSPSDWPRLVVRAAQRLCWLLKEVHSQRLVHTDVRVPNMLVHDGAVVLGDWEQAIEANSAVTVKALGDASCLAPSLLNTYTGTKSGARRSARDKKRVTLCFRPVHDLLSLAYSVACLLGGAHFSPPWSWQVVDTVVASRREWLDSHAVDGPTSESSLYNPLGRQLGEYIRCLEEIDAQAAQGHDVQVPPEMYEFRVDIPAPTDAESTRRWITAAEETLERDGDLDAQHEEDHGLDVVGDGRAQDEDVEEGGDGGDEAGGGDKEDDDGGEAGGGDDEHDGDDGDDEDEEDEEGEEGEEGEEDDEDDEDYDGGDDEDDN